jgi:choline kinase
MKVSVWDGRLIEMSKELPQEDVCGENVGVLRLTARTAADVVTAARAIIAAGDRRAWLAAAINRVADRHPITCLDVAPWPWVEIDFPEDLVRARAEVFPAVAAALVGIESAYCQPVGLRSVR